MPIRSALIQGDIGALEKIYRLHFKKVYHVIRKYINDDASVDDLVQDVFMKLWRNRKKVSTEIGIEQQLFTITKNLVFNHLRRKVLEQQYLLQQQPDIHSIPTVTPEDNSEKLREVKVLIDKLPKKQRKIFTMHKFQGLTYKEIAETLEISSHTVSSHLAEAMKFIRKNVTTNFFLW